MGNIDTKLNFRKAIVQLGAKNQVSLFSGRMPNVRFGTKPPNFHLT